MTKKILMHTQSTNDSRPSELSRAAPIELSGLRTPTTKDSRPSELSRAAPIELSVNLDSKFVESSVARRQSGAVCGSLSHKFSIPNFKPQIAHVNKNEMSMDRARRTARTDSHPPNPFHFPECLIFVERQFPQYQPFGSPTPKPLKIHINHSESRLRPIPDWRLRRGVDI